MKLQKSFKTVKVYMLLLACSSFLFGCEHIIRTEEKVTGQVVDKNISKVKIEGDCTQIPLANGLFLPLCDEDEEEERFNVTV